MTTRKCPSCGERIDAFGGNCPACGQRLGRTTAKQKKRRQRTQIYGQAPKKPRQKRKIVGTEVVGTPRELSSGIREDPHATDPGLKAEATRSARLPPAPSDPSPDSSASNAPDSSAPSSNAPIAGIAESDAPATSSPEEPAEPLAWRAEHEGSARAVGTSSRRRGSGSTSEPGTGRFRPTRPTLMNRISRLSMDVAGRTTIIELATIADRLTVETRSRIPPRFGFKIVLAAGITATTVLVVTAALAIGFWRWIPVAFLFLSFVATISWGALRALPRLALRFGAREIPGRAAAWLTLGFGVIAGVSWGVTLTVSAAAEEVGRVAWPALAPYMPERLVALEKKPPPPPPAPKPPPRKKGKKIWVDPGILFMPRNFEVVDGGFDLILFFHGNPDIVKEAVPQAGINALVHVTNLGVGSSPYQSRYIVPDSLLALIAYIEQEVPKLGLPKGLVARRVALASWSAGYGAIHSILLDPDHLARVDALLVLDGIHGGFRPNTERGVDPSTIAPFLKFAEMAVKGERLMMITHSAIPTALYTSSSEAADALLQSLTLERREVSEDLSPPQVKFKAAVDAFPISKRRWLRLQTEAQKGDFIVQGFTGDTKEDHIAHLAQMSVTVLPKLRERWSAPPATPPSVEPE